MKRIPFKKNNEVLNPVSFRQSLPRQALPGRRRIFNLPVWVCILFKCSGSKSKNYERRVDKRSASADNSGGCATPNVKFWHPTRLNQSSPNSLLKNTCTRYIFQQASNKQNYTEYYENLRRHTIRQLL